MNKLSTQSRCVTKNKRSKQTTGKCKDSKPEECRGRRGERERRGLCPSLRWAEGTEERNGAGYEHVDLPLYIKNNPSSEPTHFLQEQYFQITYKIVKLRHY